MAASAMQLHKLIKRLLDKSLSRNLSWEPAATGASFRTRIGDYVVQIQMDTPRALGTEPEPSLTVTKLDGGHVAATGSGINALLGHSITILQPGTQRLLNELWITVADRDDDIEQLIKQLG